MAYKTDLPSIQAALDEMAREPRFMDLARRGKVEALQSELYARGYNLPRHHVLQLDPSGRIVPRYQGKLERWGPAVGMVGGTMGAAIGLPALMGLGGAGAAGAAGGAGGVGGAAGAAGAAGSAAMAGMPGWLKAVLYGGAALGDVLGARGAANTAREVGESQAAADERAAAYARENMDKALAFERERLGQERSMYDQSRADLAPYRQMGGQALGALGGLMFGGGGRGDPSGGTALRGMTQTGPLVTMIAPTGQTKQVPAHLVAGYEAKGGKRIS